MTISDMGAARRPDDTMAPPSGAPAAHAAAQSEGNRTETRLPTAGMLDELAGAFASGRDALSNLLDLVALEARRASLTFVSMVAWGLVAAICLVTAWLGFMAALALWAVAFGFPVLTVVIALAVINAGAAAVLILACIAMSRDLLFAATRRQLAGKDPAMPTAP